MRSAIEYSKDCHERINWLNPKTFAKLSNIHEREIFRILIRKYIIEKYLEINSFETKEEIHQNVK